ncbi:putative protein [Arabidopsis thaliana]|uniref:Uncharacterized protein F2K15.140 n=1 Tax=Arabidopsis thaliana TaxID=3702 RepID=Q9M3A4_ARATH|nr:putative protein [Arabidopsis thaliana]
MDVEEDAEVSGTSKDVPQGGSEEWGHNFLLETWLQIRSTRPEMQDYKAIWFSDATPKERMLKWNKNVGTSCLLCNYPLETREHLFFQCPYSRTVWSELAGRLLASKYTDNWLDIMKELVSKDLDATTRIVLRTEKIIRLIDKNIRNRLSTLRVRGEEKYPRGIQVWFASRQDQNQG